MLKKFKTILTPEIVLLFLFAIIFFGCKSDNKKTNTDETEDLEEVEIDQEISDDIKEAKKIFYSLPSPLETAMLIKTAGAEYNEELLNSLDNVDDYTTNKSMALNLGIYTTDLSFASLFDQTQTSINYMSASKKLADGLGILDAIDNTTIERLEENINNRDVIMDIISETFMSSSSFLKENDRASVASIVLIGGWIEGLYIATQLVGDKPIEDNKLVERIVDQKLSFEIVLKLLEEHKEKEDIKEIINDVNKLKEVFDKIEITSSETETETTENNVTIIKSNNQIKITREVFDELTKTVESLRTKFIS